MATTTRRRRAVKQANGAKAQVVCEDHLETLARAGARVMFSGLSASPQVFLPNSHRLALSLPSQSTNR